METKKCNCCGTVWDLHDLPKTKEAEGLTYFDCTCRSTLVVKTKLLLDVLLNNAWASKDYSRE